MLSLDKFPLWVMWVLAAAGIAVIFLAVAVVTPTRSRTRSLPALLFILALFVARVAVSRDPRMALWLSFLIGSLSGLSILTVKFPRKPQLSAKEEYRRGLRAGLVLIAGIALSVVVTVLWVN